MSRPQPDGSILGLLIMAPLQRGTSAKALYCTECPVLNAGHTLSEADAINVVNIAIL